MPKLLIGNFKGPKGDPGEPGPKGDPGPKGENAVMDSELSETSENGVMNKVITKKLKEAGSGVDITKAEFDILVANNEVKTGVDYHIMDLNDEDFADDNNIVDSALSPSSTNPVQNRVITAEINSLKETVSNCAKTSDITEVNEQIDVVKNSLTSIPETYATKEELTGVSNTLIGAVNSATEGLATTTEVEEAINAATENLVTNSSMTESINAATEGLATTVEVETAINAATSSFMSREEVEAEIKKCESDGKAKVADAITRKGVSTSSEATYDEMAANIDSIPTGSGGSSGGGSGGSDGIAPSNIKYTRVKNCNGKVILYWSDPGDTIVNDDILCKWKGTKLVTKEGSYPTSVDDGTVLVDNQVLDYYKTSGYEISNLTNGETYYYMLFPYSDEDIVNNSLSEENRIIGMPKQYTKMTAKIDLSDSNPETCVSYHDDAAFMVAGSSKWDEFFGHYPVLLHNGTEVGKLDRNDFSKYEDGTDADITSGNDGDVMIAFKRLGLTIKTEDNVITVSMTDAPYDEEFEYNAHTKGSEDKDVFYIGAYFSSLLGDQARSLSGKNIISGNNLPDARSRASANGDGYSLMGYYQLIYIQCMYILKYRNLMSSSVIGSGIGLDNKGTGDTDRYGMDCDVIRLTNESYMYDGTHHVKCFGIEDLWGNAISIIDGIITSNSEILVGNSDFNDSGTGYEHTGCNIIGYNTKGHISKVTGTTKSGFMPTELKGTDKSYFCSYSYMASAIKYAQFGANEYHVYPNGIFAIQTINSTSGGTHNCIRIMYL